MNKVMIKTKTAAPFTAIAVFLLAPTAVSADQHSLEWDPSPYSQEVTECDRLASHKLDPFSVVPGLSGSQMNLPAAIEACERAVEQDPENPRLRYQLARSYGYSGRGAEGIPHRQVAVAANYPQSLFVVGYLHLLGLNGQRQDTCRAGELIRRSAQYGRQAGRIGFVRYALQDRFADCDVAVERDELAAFLDAAEADTNDYYQTLLIEMLRKQLRDSQQQ